jgi:hypothetical protein
MSRCPAASPSGCCDRLALRRSGTPDHEWRQLHPRPRRQPSPRPGNGWSESGPGQRREDGARRISGRGRRAPWELLCGPLPAWSKESASNRRSKNAGGPHSRGGMRAGRRRRQPMIS